VYRNTSFALDMRQYKPTGNQEQNGKKANERQIKIWIPDRYDVFSSTTNKYECRSSIVFCLPWVALRIVLDMSCVTIPNMNVP